MLSIFLLLISLQIYIKHIDFCGNHKLVDATVEITKRFWIK